jgi:hypothetical protein
VGVRADHDVLRPATNRAAVLLIETDSKSLIGPIRGQTARANGGPANGEAERRSDQTVIRSNRRPNRGFATSTPGVFDDRGGPCHDRSNRRYIRAVEAWAGVRKLETSTIRQTVERL